MAIEEINNKKLNVWATGRSNDGSLGQPLDLSAPTLVFIHGLGSSQNFYYGLLPQLLPKANAVLMDSVGSSQSPVAAEPPTLDSIVGDVNAVMDHFKITSKAIVVGHSMGGMITLRSAELDNKNNTNRIEKIILVGPVHPTPAIGKVFEARVSAIEKSQSVLELADAIPQAAVGSAATGVQKAFIRTLVAQQTPAGYIAMCNVIANSTPPGYSDIKIPTLILAGAEDKSAPYEGCVKVIEEGLGGEVTLTVLPGVGHWHCIEAPEAVVEAISKFI